MQITEDKTIKVEQNADRLADFIMFAQRSFLLDLSFLFFALPSLIAGIITLKISSQTIS